MLRLARSRLSRHLIGWIFAHMSFVIPVKRLRETDTLMAFYHPKPSYPLHILLVPKKALHSLGDLTAADSNFMTDLFETVNSLVAELNVEQSGYRLICNGGAYQEVPHLHFHLISEKPTL
jgi:histidine triad (HIT) family protein